jgi:hypothetical protein
MAAKKKETKKKVKKTKTPATKVKKKKRRKKKKKILIPRIVRFTKAQLVEMYGLKAKIKKSKGYSTDAKAHTITMYSPTGLYIGEVGLHKNQFGEKRMWIVFGSKGGLFCSGGKTDQVLRFVKARILEEFKGKVI